MFSFVFPIGRTAAKNNIQFQPYSSDFYNVEVEWLSVPLYSDGKTPNIFLN